MMKFTLAIALLCFSFIIGGYKYFENNSLISVKERGLKDAMRKRDNYMRIKILSKAIPKTAIEQGKDKKNNIERLLDLGNTSLKFNFIGVSNAIDSVIVKHTFSITGAITFTDMLRMLNKIRNISGFTVYKTCFGCSKPPVGHNNNEHMVSIEGFLYVYNPNLI